jgi:hypothetical protein
MGVSEGLEFGSGGYGRGFGEGQGRDQVIPGRKDPEDGERAERLEEAGAPALGLDGAVPHLFGEFADGMEGEGEEIEGGEYGCADSDDCGQRFRLNAAMRSDRRRPPVPTKAARVSLPA